MSFKGRKFTEEHKRKLSLVKLGKPRVRSELGKKSFKEKMTGENNSRWASKLFKCKFCGKQFFARRYRFNIVKYCSRLCSHKDRDFGISPKNERERKCIEYKIWRRAIFERDNYACQMCGQVGKYLHAHHIKPFSLFPKLRVDMSNGTTLCTICHKEIHKKIRLAVLNNF